MRARVLTIGLTAWLATGVALAGCTSAPAATPSASGTPSSSAAPTSPAGAYRVGPDGRLLVVDADDVLLDTGDGTVRQLAAATDGGWDVGSALGLATPVTGHLAVDQTGALTWTRPGAATVTARRVDLVSRDLSVTAAGASLAATVTEPAALAKDRKAPAVVVVHEGGPRTRADVDRWARFWAASGLVVLTYDKRGEGQSTGTFPGDAPTETVVHRLAADVSALVRTLAGQPEVDPRRLSLVGHSQAGWVAPAAAGIGPVPVAGLLLLSGSATDGAVEDAYAALTQDGQADPGLTPSALAARLADVRGEYDPAPSLRALRVPTVWVYGDRDRAVPAPLAAAAVLRDVAGARVVTLAGGDHFLYDTPHGTFDEEPAATRYAPGLFPLLVGWARSR